MRRRSAKHVCSFDLVHRTRCRVYRRFLSRRRDRMGKDFFRLFGSDNPTSRRANFQRQPGNVSNNPLILSHSIHPPQFRIGFITYGLASSRPSPLLCQRFFQQFGSMNKEMKDESAKFSIGQTGIGSSSGGMAALEGIVAALEVPIPDPQSSFLSLRLNPVDVRQVPPIHRPFSRSIPDTTAE